MIEHGSKVVLSALVLVWRYPKAQPGVLNIDTDMPKAALELGFGLYASQFQQPAPFGRRPGPEIRAGHPLRDAASAARTSPPRTSFGTGSLAASIQSP